jgi:nickel transport protein
MGKEWRSVLRLLKRLPVLGLGGLLFLMVFVSPALSHRMLVFAYAEGDTIHSEAKFVPDTPVRGGKVLVLEQGSGRELLTGETDNRGKFSFKVPKEAAAGNLDLKIVVEAGMGHRGEWLLKAGSYGRNSEPLKNLASAANRTAVQAAPGPEILKLESQALETILTRVLERQLAPLHARLAEMAVRRVSLTDVVAGLGYLLGFFGLWAYFKSKGQRKV